MNILILYAKREKKNRKTISDSLFCFSRYDKKNHYYYLNIIDIKSVQKCENVKFPLSAIIVHYTVFAERYGPIWWNKNKDIIIQMVKSFNCIKIIIPQDEYNYNNCIREFIKEGGVERIYTCAYEEDFEKIYPRELGYKYIETVFTGYIDQKTLKKINKKGYNSERNIDLGYRARKLPYWLGKHGQLKSQLAEEFLNYFKSHRSNLIYDIANTDDLKTNVILGDEWIKYLLNCRTMLGCLGGSGLLDIDGSIAQNVNKYCMEHPEATFEEVEEKCFKGMDNYIHLFALSPRHFECAMTKTCQVLVEGDYKGVLYPNIDYIEIKKDFSNLKDVIEKIADIEYCKEIAENCYRHVVLSEKYTYSKFVEKIIENIEEDINCKYLLKLRIICEISKFRSKYIVPLTSICRLSMTDILSRLFLCFLPFKETGLYKIMSKSGMHI